MRTRLLLTLSVALAPALATAQAEGPAFDGNLSPATKYNSRSYGVWPLPTGSMKCGICFMAASTSTTLGCTIIGAGVVNGTPAAQPALTGATRMYVEWASAATTNSVAGWGPTGANIRAQSKPMMGATFRWPGEANLIFWTGVAETTLAALTPDTGPTVSGVDFAAVGFQSSVSANFRGCTGDGTNYSCADLVGGASAPVSAHEYYVLVDTRTETGVATSFTLYDLTAGTTATLRKTTNVLRTANSFGVNLQASITTTENVAKLMQLADIFNCFN